jgi:hypothetical protein
MDAQTRTAIAGKGHEWRNKQMNEKDKPQEPKKSLDERLEALTIKLELLTHTLDDMLKRMEIQDQRERMGRRALLVAMKAYLQALNGEEEQ